MVTRVKIRHSLLAVASLLAISCSQPVSYEEFIKVSDAANGVYSYDLDLSDPLASYDVSFYTRIDRSSVRIRTEYPQIRLKVSWVSPSGDGFSETVYMKGSRSGESCQKYRSGIVPKEPGMWKLNVEAFPAEDGLRGLGIVCKRNGSR